MAEQKFSTINEVLAYVSAEDSANTDPRHLVSGSKNVIIDRQRKVRIRNGYTRLGAANSALTAMRSNLSWHNSTGLELPMRVYDDELEVYLGTIDTVDVNAWTRVMNGLSTTETPRFAVWWDTGENIDQLLFVQGNANHYKWGGGIAVLSAGGTNTLTKKGTGTWAQNRFYTTGSKTIINTRTGVVFTYTGGETTTTLTGVTPDPAGDDVLEDDVFVQEVRTHTNEPAASRNNDTIFVFENQVFFGSNDDNEVYVTANDDTTDTAFSAPRIPGEGALLTLDGTSRGFGVVSNKLLLFAGQHSLWRALYNEITVSTTLTESLSAKRLETGDLQGALSPDCIVQIGKHQLAYLSNEPALRVIDDPDKELSTQPRTLSNPIKPDFDAAVFTNAWGLWHKNSLYISAPSDSKLFILEFVEDADGRLRRFWQPPQVLPVRSLFVFDGDLHAGSNSVAETYKLFDGLSDTSSDDSKIPIDAVAAFAYRTFDRREGLKNFDEYYIEGEIQRNTKLEIQFNYGWGGAGQTVVAKVDPANEDILETETFGGSLGQTPLGQNPLAGIFSAPADAVRFQQIIEVAKEDFSKFQVIFKTNDTDQYWSILSHGPRVELSRRRNTTIKV